MLKTGPEHLDSVVCLHRRWRDATISGHLGHIAERVVAEGARKGVEKKEALQDLPVETPLPTGGRLPQVLFGLICAGILALLLSLWMWMGAVLPPSWAERPRVAATSENPPLTSRAMGSQLSVIPSKEVQFGNTPLLGTKTEIIFIINSGTEPLSVDKLVLSEFSELRHFSIVANSCDAPVPSHRFCRLELLFNPKTRGEKTAKLQIHTNAAPEAFPLSISGTGKQQP